MAYEFRVEFGDDFGDHIAEVAEEAVQNMDFTDLIRDNIDDSEYVKVDDMPDMDDYPTNADFAAMEDRVRQLEDTARVAQAVLSDKVQAMGDKLEAINEVFVAMVYALARAGIVAEVTK
jgi:hypothetical protein